MIRWSNISRRSTWAVIALVAAGLGTIGGATAGGAEQSLAATKGLGSPDRSCNNGAPVRIHTPLSFGLSNLLTVNSPDGGMIVGTASSTNSQMSLVLHAFTRPCGIDRTFGRRGISIVTHSSTSKYEGIDAIAAGLGGTYLIVGNTGPSIIVGRLLHDGAMDTSFGAGGWSTISIPNESVGVNGTVAPVAESVTQARSGAIYVGANDGSAHCCVRAWVAALTPSGQLVHSFGQAGWAMVLPQGDYFAKVFVVPDGSLQVIGEVIYGGCGGPQLTTLSSLGVPNASVSKTFGSTWTRGYSDPSMTADFYQRPNGLLTSVSHIASPCAGSGKVKQAEELIGFLPTGGPDPSFGTGGYTVARGTDINASSVWAVPFSNGEVDAVTEAAAYKAPFIPTAMNLRAFSANGVTRVVGGRGSATFNLGQASHRTEYPEVNALPGPRHTIELIIGSPSGIELTRLVG